METIAFVKSNYPPVRHHSLSSVFVPLRQNLPFLVFAKEGYKSRMWPIAI
jgi:hypothetical protein